MSKADKLLKRVEFYEKMASTQQKPENDALLNRASLYERLALYSDRKSFLQALGGGATSGWSAKQHSDAEIKAALQKVVDGTIQWNQQYGTRVTDATGSPRVFPKNVAQDQYNISQSLDLPSYNIDHLNLINRSLSNLAQLNNKGFERDALEAWTQLVFRPATDAQQKVGEQISSIKEWQASIPPDTSSEVATDTQSQPAPQAKSQARPAAPAINRADQAAVARLFRDMVIKGDAPPVADTNRMNDGILGPETRKALEAIKDFYKRKNPQNARMTDQEAINAAKSPASQIG